MVEMEHKCFGCGMSHLAGLWYFRERATKEMHICEWLCGNKHAALSDRDKGGWLLDESPWMGP
jgi:hypothetical protein